MAIATYAVALLMIPAARPPFLRDRIATIPFTVYGHLLFGGIALATGAFQFNASLRAKRLSLHRLLGRIYVVSVFASGLTALVMASVSQGGMTAHLGFGTLAILWLVSTSTAYRMITARDVVRHRQWMIRSYSLTLAAVMLRIYLPISLIAGIPFDDAYPAISWLCWVPNLIVAEWLVLRSASAGLRPSPTAVA